MLSLFFKYQFWDLNVKYGKKHLYETFNIKVWNLDKFGILVTEIDKFET